MSIDAKRLEQIEARTAAATPGPWAREMYEDGEQGEGPYGVHPGCRGEMVESNDIIGAPVGADTYEEGYANAPDVATCYNGRDAAFIAAARTDVPDLCARVRELEAALEQAGRARDRAQKAIVRWHESHASGPFGEARLALRALADVAADLRASGVDP